MHFSFFEIISFLFKKGGREGGVKVDRGREGVKVDRGREGGRG